MKYYMEKSLEKTFNFHYKKKTEQNDIFVCLYSFHVASPVKTLNEIIIIIICIHSQSTLQN